MKFYRPLKSFKVISFDLDDTLYDNHPIIKKAESDFLCYLNKTYAHLSELNAHQWGLYKNHLLRERPELMDDVSLLRLELLKRIMCIYGITPYKAIAYAEQALTEFLRLRSNFTVPAASIDLLQKLSAHYPVIAITNGNVDTHQIGLAHHFKFVLKAGDGYKAKPHADLFNQAALRLNVSVSDIVHIGDNLVSDVFGAQNSGAQSIWLNENKQSLADAKLLPTVEITQLNQLYSLLIK
ncbi:HAD family hydrolase [Psychromonas sp. CNPT3]|uniref:HAD-IA family hydrolase n=1 Tax=Psychromonas sp. CNPT3 TaxID=314282 RepID=UPI00006E50B2|nr:HAD-IA family hydrolase [Psychromonas sp. CNPT3]AGH80004.1 HAD family hydrolase [Psychromonas sp. CNPT3]